MIITKIYSHDRFRPEYQCLFILLENGEEVLIETADGIEYFKVVKILENVWAQKQAQLLFLLLWKAGSFGVYLCIHKWLDYVSDERIENPKSWKLAGGHCSGECGRSNESFRR